MEVMKSTTIEYNKHKYCRFFSSFMIYPRHSDILMVLDGIFNVLERLQLNCLTFIEYNINPAQQSQKIERITFQRITVVLLCTVDLVGVFSLHLQSMFWWQLKPKIVCPASQEEKSSPELMRPIMFFFTLKQIYQ